MKSSINILSIILNVFLIFAVIVLLFDRDDEEEYGEEIYDYDEYEVGCYLSKKVNTLFFYSNQALYKRAIPFSILSINTEL